MATTSPEHNVIRALQRLDEQTLDVLCGRSLLLTTDWADDEIEAVCSLAEAFEALDRVGVATPLFPCELDYAMFFDNSTRTKSSWAGAAARLGSSAVIVDGSSTQVAHGETAAETGAMLGMNAHALGVRHDLILGQGNAFMREVKRGIDDYLVATKDRRAVPVVNLQCDVDHPTQTLADLCWLRERFADGLRGKTIAVSWAYSPSYAKPLSVPQGLITVLSRMGMDVRLAHPAGYTLMDDCVDAAQRAATASGGSFTQTDDMDAAFAGADIVYPKSWGPHELMLRRVEANDRGDDAAIRAIETQALERNRGFTNWICDERRMGLTRNGEALYMHCLPVDIGAEVSEAVMRRSRVDVAREANKKVYVIMALLAAAKATKLPQQLQTLWESQR